jgi:hypothetical protein
MVSDKFHSLGLRCACACADHVDSYDISLVALILRLSGTFPLGNLAFSVGGSENIDYIFNLCGCLYGRGYVWILNGCS